MRRTIGLTLLALGLLCLAVAAVCGLIAAAEQDRGDVFTVASTLAVPLLFAGLLILFLSAIVLRVSPPHHAPVPTGQRVHGFIADQVEKRMRGKRAYEVYYTSPRPKVQPSLVVRVAAKSPTTAHFTEENWFDRLCKRLGIAQKVQTGDREFDEAIYVRCPSDGFAREYLQNAGRRRAILTLRKAGFASVQLTGTAVEAHWPEFDPNAAGVPEMGDVAGHLMTLSDGMPADPQKAAARSNRRLMACLLLWLAAIGYAATLSFAFTFPPVRMASLWAVAVPTFPAIYVGFGWLAARLLRGESVSHDRWAWLMAVGVLLLGAGTLGLVAGVNGLADVGGPVVRAVTVTSKRGATSKGSHTYYVTVPDWSSQRTLEFRVTPAEYEAIEQGRSRLELTIGRGALGIEWLRSMRVRP